MGCLEIEKNTLNNLRGVGKQEYHCKSKPEKTSGNQASNILPSVTHCSFEEKRHQRNLSQKIQFLICYHCINFTDVLKVLLSRCYNPHAFQPVSKMPRTFTKLSFFFCNVNSFFSEL